jgi:translation initiation factor 5
VNAFAAFSHPIPFNWFPFSPFLIFPPFFKDPTKFFGFELGALTHTANDRYIVNGKHSAEDLAKLLDQFIEKFVLCKHDRNPETVMQINSRGEIELHCKACGNVTPVDMTHKLATYILNNPPSKY